MIVYRVLHSITLGYPLAVLWTYVAAFVLAFLLIFVHPFLTIVIFFTGLVGLVAFVLAFEILRRLEHRVARVILDSGTCPGCGRAVGTARDPSRAWACDGCASSFEPGGGQTAS